MEKGRHRISYVKKPLAKRSFMAIGLSCAATCLFLAGMAVAVNSNGQAGLNVGAAGFLSILFSLVSLWYGGISFLEKDKNYILSKVSLGLSGILIFTWILMIIEGIRR